jgi:hypothetical protein
MQDVFIDHHSSLVIAGSVFLMIVFQLIFILLRLFVKFIVFKVKAFNLVTEGQTKNEGVDQTKNEGVDQTISVGGDKTINEGGDLEIGSNRTEVINPTLQTNEIGNETTNEEAKGAANEAVKDTKIDAKEIEHRCSLHDLAEMTKMKPFFLFHLES